MHLTMTSKNNASTGTAAGLQNMMILSGYQPIGSPDKGFSSKLISHQRGSQAIPQSSTRGQNKSGYLQRQGYPQRPINA